MKLKFWKWQSYNLYKINIIKTILKLGIDPILIIIIIFLKLKKNFNFEKYIIEYTINSYHEKTLKTTKSQKLNLFPSYLNKK